jgi:hypothetical protein
VLDVRIVLCLGNGFPLELTRKALQLHHASVDFIACLYGYARGGWCDADILLDLLVLYACLHAPPTLTLFCKDSSLCII